MLSLEGVILLTLALTLGFGFWRRKDPFGELIFFGNALH